jgi:hypothetical protein
MVVGWELLPWESVGHSPFLINNIVAYTFTYVGFALRAVDVLLMVTIIH